MAEEPQRRRYPADATSGYPERKGTSTSQVLAVVTLFPIGAALFCLAGLTLAFTLLGLAVSSVLFAVFSPVLIPAILTISFSVVGFLTSGAFGVTALSSLSWLINYLRKTRGRSLSEQFEYARRELARAVGDMGRF